MKHQINTIREALEFFECGSYSTSKALTALTALAELERLAGEQKPVARVDGEGQVAWFAPIPEDGANLYATPPAQQPHDRVAVTWDKDRTRILAVTLQDADGRVLCVIDEAPAQQQYEAGDMASAAAQGFRDGVASVAQQPQEIEVVCPVCSHTFYAWPGEHKVQQPRAEAVPVHQCTGAGDIALGTKSECSFCSPQQAEAVHHKPVRVCHIKDVACYEAAVKCGECPDAAPQQAEAVPNDVTRDAARYLWLRSKVGVSPEHERAYIWLPCGNSKINPAETDAAIDAAMAQGANHG